MAVGGHVVVCGMGHVGTRVARILRRLGREVVIVTHDEGGSERPLLGATVLRGDARDQDVLGRAGLADASAVVAATSSDLVNLEVALEVRRTHPDLPVVARLYDQALARELEASLGLRRAPAKSTLAAPAFAAAALGMTVRGAFDRDGKAYVWGVVKEDDVPPGSAVLERSDGRATIVTTESAWKASLRRRAPGAKPRKLMSPLEWVRAVARLWRNAPRILRTALVGTALLTAVSVGVFGVGMNLSPVDAFYFVVTTITTTGYGDITPKDSGPWMKLYGCLLMILGSMTMATLYSLVTDFVVAERVATAERAHEAPEGDHVVVVGVGNLGLRVAGELAKNGVEVACVTRDRATDHSRDLDTVVFEGDARAPAVLTRAGTDRAAAVLALTNDDAANLGIALAARRLHPGIRAVVRVYDEDLAEKVEQGLSLTALSASAIAAPTFAASACEDGIIEGFLEGDALVVLRERSVPEDWRGKTAGSAELVLREAGLATDRDQPVTVGERVVVIERWPLASA